MDTWFYPSKILYEISFPFTSTIDIWNGYVIIKPTLKISP